MDGENVIAVCEALVDFHAWDPTKIDAQAWLGNFDSADLPLAGAMLSRFSFYADHLVDQLLLSAFQNLSNMAIAEWRTFSETQSRWQAFCANMLVTPVQGENPNPSDSGFLFARKARQVLGVSEAKLLTPTQVISRLETGYAGAVVFVDDFVGSGEQFIRTWSRPFPAKAGGTIRFRDLAASNPTVPFFYCNAMTTTHGMSRIAMAAPNVLISAGNVIPPDHSLSSPQSALWRPDQAQDGIAMIKRKSLELGFDESFGGPNDWEGFHKLGLALAFEHCVPDATLPIFHTDRCGWKPLVRRS